MGKRKHRFFPAEKNKGERLAFAGPAPMRAAAVWALLALGIGGAVYSFTAGWGYMSIRIWPSSSTG